jgi:hypothetical protein
MLTILLVSPPDFPDIVTTHPSLELLHAHDLEDALEKLGRNRRIDALLLAGWEPAVAGEIVRSVQEDNPAPPPLYALGPPVPGTRPLPPPLVEALETLKGELAI